MARRPKLSNDQSRRLRWAKDGYTQNPDCYLCQQAPATTDDHVPPKGLFATTRGADAYHLPACDTCNGMLNEDENYLRNVLASSGTNDEAGKALQTTLRSFQGSSPLYPFNNRSQFFKNTSRRDFYSPAGIWTGRLPTFDVDVDRINPMIVKIVRGLHYHDHKLTLSADLSFDVFSFFPMRTAPLTAWLEEMRGMRPSATGTFPNVLSYVSWSVKEYPDSSMWVLLCHRSVAFTVMVSSTAILAREQADFDGLLIRPSSTICGADDTVA
jgi:hypothetical protein